MKSVRLNADLEAKLERAGRALATSPFEFIREAMGRRYDEILGASLAASLASAIGIVKSSGGRGVIGRGLPPRSSAETPAMILADTGPLTVILDPGEQHRGRPVDAGRAGSGGLLDTRRQ
jgi:hypothetical protein